MIKLPDDIARRDIDQWLSHGWVYVVTKEGLQVAKYRGVDDEGKVAVMTVDGARRSYLPKNVRAHWPLCGGINLPEQRFALYVQRKAQQQYRRTFNGRNVVCIIPGKWGLLKKLGSNGLMYGSIDSPNVIQALFKPHYPSVDECLEKLDAGEWFSICPTPHITLVGDKDYKQVYHRGALAGEIIDDMLVSVSDLADVNRINKQLGGRFMT